jgi:hypothetical protein
MKFFFKYAFPLLLAGVLFIGCEKQEYFKSKKGVEKQLQGNWNRVRLGKDAPQEEIWNFNDGTLIISGSGAKSINVTDTIGNYSIKTTLLKVFITTENLPAPCSSGIYCLVNNKWQVILLNDQVLDIATDGCNGVIEREFTKQ